MKRFLSAKTWAQKVIHAGFWAFLLKAVEYGFVFSRIIILARLLQPEDFGLFGIGLMSIMALNTFSNTGFDQALIQKKEAIESYLNTAWTTQAFRGFILALVMWAMAPLVAAFFSEPEITPFLRVIGIAMIFYGLINIGVVRFQKDLDFRREFVFQFSGHFASFVVSVLCALLWRNAWALAFGFIARNFTLMIVSYLVHPYRPRVHFDRDKFTALFKYGIWMLFSSVMMFIGAQGPGMIIGKVLGIGALGFYQFASRIPQMTIHETSMTIGKIAFPAYSQLQESSERLREAYLRIAGVSAALYIPVTIGIMVVGEDFVSIFLGDKWMPIVPVLTVLVLADLIRSIAMTGGPVFMGSGIPKVLFHMQIARAVTVMLIIYPLAVHWGIYGASFAVLFSHIAMLIVSYLKIRVQIALTKKDMVRLFAPPLSASIIMAAAVYGFKTMTVHWRLGTDAADMVWFCSMIMAGGLVYLSVMVFLDRMIPGYQVLKGLNRRRRG